MINLGLHRNSPYRVVDLQSDELTAQLGDAPRYTLRASALRTGLTPQRIAALANPWAEPIAVISRHGTDLWGSAECVIVVTTKRNGQLTTSRFLIEPNELDDYERTDPTQ